VTVFAVREYSDEFVPVHVVHQPGLVSYTAAASEAAVQHNDNRKFRRAGAIVGHVRNERTLLALDDDRIATGDGGLNLWRIDEGHRDSEYRGGTPIRHFSTGLTDVDDAEVSSGAPPDFYRE
jgi:hypothetical protein